MDNGLPQNSVKDIVKDKYGFIWIVTESEIIRYNGQKFERFDKTIINDFHLGDFYGSIEKDSLIVFEEGQKKQILLQNRQLKILQDKKIKRTYRDKYGKSCALFNKNSIETAYFNDQNYYIDLTDEHYIFNNGNEIVHLRKGKKRNIPIAYHTMKNIFVINGILFIRDMKYKKVHAFRNGESVDVKFPALLFSSDSKISWQQTTGQMFIINQNKLYRGSFENNTLKFDLLLTNETFKTPYHSIFYDKDYSKIYLGSLVKGLTILSQSGFTNVDENYVAYSSLPFTQSTIITPEGLELGRKGIIKDYHFNNYQQKKLVMIYDQNNNILHSRGSTILKFHKNTNYKTSDSINFGNRVVSKIFRLKKNRISIVLTDTYNNNFLHICDSDKLEKPIHSFRFNNEITSLSEIDTNDFLIGTDDNILKLSIKDGKIRKIANNINVKQIIKNNDGTFWIITKIQGIFLLDSSRLISLPLDKNEALLSAHYILEDTQKNLWISSNNGLFKTTKAEVFAFVKNKNKIPHYYRYDTKNGLINNEFNGSSIPNAYQLGNSDFVFPSMVGFVIFNPNDIQYYYPKKGGLRVERMKIDKENIQYFKDKIKVKSDFKNIKILLDIPYYSNDENLHIDIKQNNGLWRNMTGDRELNLSNLKPGKYNLTFRIFLGTKDCYEYRIIVLEVIPFFYETIFFYVFIVLLVVITLIMIIYVRTKRLSMRNKKLRSNIKEQNIRLKEKAHKLADTEKQLASESEYQKKIIESISHDITTPLKFISSMSQKLLESNDPEIQKQYFESICKSSEELYKFTHNLKEYAKLFKDSDSNNLYNIQLIVEEKKILFSEIAKQKNITILNKISSELYFNTNKKIFAAILHNLIDNSLKNTENGAIEISNIDSDNQITIIIKDSGKGMPEEQILFYNNLSKTSDINNLSFKKIGLGLRLVIQLVKNIDGEITFQKNEPQGTSVVLTLK
ncbi:sensor histidine kinase [Elizabethkingia miricola]|uniref:sensor histidine kinase n=1 Tax=Elizabethkingia miricola TaxID=172045 RepID=UPI002ACD41C9|nr:HAMP domain-containing sensor histidine kinase [Elizabethkingia miricola]WQM39452.1 HAMP domain-containing sensor histidine kinase [Elizabethkingia miricola]